MSDISMGVRNHSDTDKLQGPWGEVIRALLRAPVAWQSPEEIAGALGWGVEETTDILADMDVEGWLDVWETAAEPAPAVTLSVLLAMRLGVRLVERGQGRHPQWASVDDPEPGPPRAPRVCRGDLAAAMTFVPDPAPGPDEAAELAEPIAQAVPPPTDGRPAVGTPAPADRLPWPTLLLGQNLTPWPGPNRDPNSACPSCGTRLLPPHVYCLCCDRWGMDPVLSALIAPNTSRTSPGGTRSGPPAPARPQDTTCEERAKLQAARAHRKARRKARLHGLKSAERGSESKPTRR